MKQCTQRYEKSASIGLLCDSEGQVGNSCRRVRAAQAARRMPRANPSQNVVTGCSGSMSCPESCNTTNMFAAVTELVSLLAGIHL